MNPSTDNHEQFVGLLTRHERVIRGYIRATIRRAEDVDEVMQNVSIVAWRKFNSLTDAAGFIHWACVIARYEILKFQRAQSRNRLQLDESLALQILEEGEAEVDQSAARMDLLEGCISRLPERSRIIVLKAYAISGSIQQVASDIGKTPDALYQMLRRIRQELLRCVEQRLAQERRVT